MRLERMKWYVKQLLPLSYWTTYRTEDGRRWFAIWRMWLGRSFDVVHLPAVPDN